MTDKEAKLYLNRISTIFHLDGEYKRAIDVAIEALEKEIPKKPIWELIGGYDVYSCPYCHQHCVKNKILCDSCGQLISWSDME